MNLALFNDDYPKPTALIKYLTQMVSGNDFLILDFFAGSGTTAHSVLDLNKEEGGSRRFILVQLPEPCREGSEAKKAGYDTISEIAKDRIRKCLEKQNSSLLDKDHDEVGFRCFKPVFHANVRFRADFVCSTPRNRHSRRDRGMTVCDPKPP